MQSNPINYIALENERLIYKTLIRSARGHGATWHNRMTSSASAKGEGSANVLEERTVTFINIVLSFPLHSTY